MALTSLSSLVYSSFSAFVLPFTDWKKRLEGEIRPFFPGIKPVDIEEKGERLSCKNWEEDLM